MAEWYYVTNEERGHKLSRGLEWLKKASKFKLYYDKEYPPKDYKEIVQRMLAFHEGSLSPRGKMRTIIGKLRTVEDTLRTINYYFPKQDFKEVIDYIEILRNNHLIRSHHCNMVKKYTHYTFCNVPYHINHYEAHEVLPQNLPYYLEEFKKEFDRKC